MHLLTQQKISACLIPGTTKDQSDTRHRTESHHSGDGKGLANSKPGSTSGKAPPNEFALELRGGMEGGENRGPPEEHTGASQTGAVGAAMCPAFC